MARLSDNEPFAVHLRMRENVADRCSAHPRGRWGSYWDCDDSAVAVVTLVHLREWESYRAEQPVGRHVRLP